MPGDSPACLRHSPSNLAWPVKVKELRLAFQLLPPTPNPVGKQMHPQKEYLGKHFFLSVSSFFCRPQSHGTLSKSPSWELGRGWPSGHPSPPPNRALSHTHRTSLHKNTLKKASSAS